ncbi:MAG: glycosyltransferase [Planctomycetes bacterium]|nr:glycosyltransferase [Planctomycetota bacterium]
MNNFIRNSSACLLGLSPATAVLPAMLQANGRSNNSRQTGLENGESSGRVFSGSNGRVHAGHHHFDQELAQSESSAKSRVRVALYSHDTMGLGHLRRNLLIAQALSESPLQATTLLITGAHEANFFSLPPDADFLTLPRMHKDAAGRYTAGQLAISVEDLVRLRGESIRSALNAFRPDVVIVDKVPGGAFGEMLPALRSVSEKYGTQCVLGIRDVLDEAAVVRSEWLESSHQVIDDFYDELWVYGDRRVYDPIEEYDWQQGLADKVRFTGYLDQARRLDQSSKSVSQDLTDFCTEDEHLVVCALGGGQDGFPLAESFVEALPPTGTKGILLAGPFMPPHLLRSIQKRVATRSNIRVLEFTAEADQIIRRADRVVAMGGYNTVCAILSYRKPALLVPRVSPRSEQWIRAERLQQLGLLETIHPEALTTETLRDWLEKEVPRPKIHPEVIDFAGLDRIGQLVTRLLGRKVNDRTTLTRGTV